MPVAGNSDEWNYSVKSMKSILIVEDEALIRMGLADTLWDMGYDVVEAADADQALGWLERRSDIIAVITDVDMPGSIDGRELAEVVSRRWPPCKLIVVSGHHHFEERDLPAGARFAGKPLQPRHLTRLLTELGIAA